MLTPEEEADLLEYRPEQWAVDRLVQAYMPAIKRRVSRYRTRQFYADIFQEGVCGLLTAIKNFTPAEGSKFARFAYAHIAGAVKMFMRASVHALALPRTANLVPKGELTAESVSEIAASTLNSRDHLLESDVITLNGILSGRVSGEESLTWQVSEDPSPEEMAEQSEMRRRVRALSPTHREIILSRYVIDEPLSRRDLGKKFGCSAWKIDALEKEAWKQLCGEHFASRCLPPAYRRGNTGPNRYSKRENGAFCRMEGVVQ